MQNKHLHDHTTLQANLPAGEEQFEAYYRQLEKYSPSGAKNGKSRIDLISLICQHF